MVRHERAFGPVRPGSVVLMNSDWAQCAGDPDAFKNTDGSGTYHFPGFSADAAEFLVDKRRVRGLGVDTLSIDAGAVGGFPVHHRILGADLFALENLANLDRIPASGSQIFVGVVPYEQGSGSPCRVIARY